MRLSFICYDGFRRFYRLIKNALDARGTGDSVLYLKMIIQFCRNKPLKSYVNVGFQKTKEQTAYYYLLQPPINSLIMDVIDQKASIAVRSPDLKTYRS